jgi:probable rRNA maturation factor
MLREGLEVGVQVEAPWREAVDEAAVRELASRVLMSEGVAAPAEVSVVITDDETLRELNRRYLDRDEPTDVLSFALGEESTQTEVGEPFVGPPDGVSHLGEVIVSFPTAERQAREQGHGVDREIAHLVVHGLLHLLGYDHQEPEEEQRMRSLEDGFLAAAGRAGRVRQGSGKRRPRPS